MLIPRVIPCLLLRDLGLVKTVKFRDPKYVGDPRNAVKIYNEKEVDELVFLDISATPGKRGPNLKLIEEIASECFMPLGYGGGIRNLEDIKSLFRIGIEKVVINSRAVENPELITEAANCFGSQSIVVSMDAKRNFLGKYTIYTHCGRKKTKFDPVEYAKRAEQLGAGELILNSIDRDGTQSGYDTELIRSVADAVRIPVVAGGGAGNIEHLAEAVYLGGASAVTAGSLFVFHGKHRAVLISYPTMDELHRTFASHAEKKLVGS